MGMLLTAPSVYNVGPNFSITFQHLRTGTTLTASSFGQVAEFESGLTTVRLHVRRISEGGKPMPAALPDGERGHIQFIRYNGAFGGIISLIEQDYYVSGFPTFWNMYVTVQNPDSTIDEYLFPSTVMHEPGLGNARADNEVDFRLEWEAPEMIVTDGLAALIPSAA